jgi:hypothetical protein
VAYPFNELRERLLRGGIAPRHVRRYLAELADHLTDLRAEEERAGRSRADAESAALIRLGGVDDLARAMIGKRQLQSWCARAPWAIFGVAPLLLLAAVWSVALFLLWTGWQVFLAGYDTPFVRVPTTGPHPLFELANLYFQLDRLLYFGAPILVGWTIGIVAARQRLKALWPAIGLVVIGLVGGMSQVHAGHSAVPHGIGHISMSFTLAPSAHGGPFGLLQLLVLPITALPYLIWRIQKTHFPSS